MEHILTYKFLDYAYSILGSLLRLSLKKYTCAVLDSGVHLQLTSQTPTGVSSSCAAGRHLAYPSATSMEECVCEPESSHAEGDGEHLSSPLPCLSAWRVGSLTPFPCLVPSPLLKGH